MTTKDFNLDGASVIQHSPHPGFLAPDADQKKFNRRPIVPTLFQAPTGCEKLSCDATYGHSNYFRCEMHRILPMMKFGLCLCSLRWRASVARFGGAHQRSELTTLDAQVWATDARSRQMVHCSGRCGRSNEPLDTKSHRLVWQMQFTLLDLKKAQADSIPKVTRSIMWCEAIISSLSK